MYQKWVVKLVGVNSNTLLIYIGIFFVMGSTIFIIPKIEEKYKINIIRMYIGIFLIISAIGIFNFLKFNSIASIIPILFIITGVILIIQNLKNKSKYQ